MGRHRSFASTWTNCLTLPYIAPRTARIRTAIALRDVPGGNAASGSEHDVYLLRAAHHPICMRGAIK
jgi:hypothetical protein